MLSLYRLPAMMPGENVIKIVRRGFFVFFKRLVFLLLLAVIPLAVAYAIILGSPEILYDPIIFPLLTLGASGYYLFVWLFFFFNFIDYYLNVFALTNERIIDIKQEGFFARTISEQRLSRVQDVTSEVDGLFPTIFKYGNILVQTAGEQEQVYFKDIAHPDEIRDLVIKVAESRRHGQKEPDKDQ